MANSVVFSMRCRGGIIALMVLWSVLHPGSTQQQRPTYCPRVPSNLNNPVGFRPNPPRVHSFCIGKDPESNQWDNEIVKTGFDKVIEDIYQTRYRNGSTNSTKPGVDGFKYEKSEDHIFWLPRQSPLQYGFVVHNLVHNYGGKGTPRQAIMDYWLVISVLGLYDGEKSSALRNIQGVYAQGIMGPLGIPFGEFVDDILYKRDNYNPPQADAPTEFTDNVRLYPCTFYSRAGVSIPNVFMWSNKGTNYQGHMGNFNLTFKWDESPCHNVNYFQFLMIVVYDWNNLDYKAGIGMVMLPGALKFSTHGVSYPYYPDWGRNEVSTNRNNPALGTKDFFDYSECCFQDERIIPNLDYEHCVQHKVGLVVSGPQKGSCPPGPFQCSQSFALNTRPTDKDQLQRAKADIWGLWARTGKSYNTSGQNCSTGPVPTPAPTTASPTTSTTTTSPPTIPSPPSPTKPPRPLSKVDNHTAKVTEVAKKVEQQKIIKHGDLCVFVWFVLFPFSNYIARFLKDFKNFASFGLGFWIMGHMFLHYMGVFLMWISFGMVISNGYDFLGGAPTMHYIFSFPTTLIQHYELFTGGTRDLKIQTAQRQSLLHVIAGYLSGVMSLCCSETTRMLRPKAYLLYIMFGVNVLWLVGATILERRISRRLGMYPPRKMFPVLERIVMVNTRPRAYKLKILLTLIYIAVILFLCFLYWAYDSPVFGLGYYFSSKAKKLNIQ